MAINRHINRKKASQFMGGSATRSAKLFQRSKQQNKTEQGIHRDPTNPVEVQMLFARNTAAA